MKDLSFLLTLLLLSRIALCQPSTLEPTVIKKDSVELKCFYPNQYSDIVGRISNELYCDSIESVNAQIIKEQLVIIQRQESLAASLRAINKNSQGQITNLNIINSTLKLDLAKAQEEVSKHKRRRWLYFGVGILSSAAITLAVN